MHTFGGQNHENRILICRMLETKNRTRVVLLQI